MKKILAILFFLSVYLAPSYAQLEFLYPIVQSVGSAAMKGAGIGVGNALSKKVEAKVADKVEKMTTKKLDKMWGPDEQPSDSARVANAAEGGSVGVFSGLSTIMGEFSSNITSGLSALMDEAQSAANAPLRDFSEKNAVRKEHNLTLEYDDWD